MAGKKKNFRQGDAEKASKPSRRLEIRLPADHFIFEVKEGSRSKVAVELLDLAKRLERIEERLAALESAGIRSPGPKDSEKKGFDAAGFFAAFD
ncbi:hypothetical protein EDD75_2215 [Thermodesulfitimonas autotrophica]|uniref:Uncharacterized protein n=1 Tax=Thermodesulfitimonas autotrophica TaxID=1894989 RepID=A0A3N5ABN1_9THEO|nr:hypothetical protein EDD75_2215 [Thermodesulfitimonas autotrophica]